MSAWIRGLIHKILVGGRGGASHDWGHFDMLVRHPQPLAVAGSSRGPLSVGALSSHGGGGGMAPLAPSRSAYVIKRNFSAKELCMREMREVRERRENQ